MTIRKGEPWGEPGSLPDDGHLVRSDAEISTLVAECRREHRDVPPLGLLGGDLARTCGATGSEDRLRGPEAQCLPVDLGEVLVDGVLHHFAAHLVARRSWWHGRVVVVMNAQHIGRWNVAPRSHPNDGRLEVFDCDLDLGDRWKAWRRLPTGTHVPHPGIHVQRVKATQIDLDPGMRVWRDGVALGPARALSVRCVPDALSVVV